MMNNFKSSNILALIFLLFHLFPTCLGVSFMIKNDEIYEVPPPGIGELFP